MIYSGVVQDRLSHRLYWLHDGDCGLVIWDRAADHLEDEEAVRGEQRDDTTLCVAARWRHRLVSNTAWRRYARLRVLWRDVDHLVAVTSHLSS